MTLDRKRWNAVLFITALQERKIKLGREGERWRVRVLKKNTRLRLRLFCQRREWRGGAWAWLRIHASMEGPIDRVTPPVHGCFLHPQCLNQLHEVSSLPCYIQKKKKDWRSWRVRVWVWWGWREREREEKQCCQLWIVANSGLFKFCYVTVLECYNTTIAAIWQHFD